MRKIDELIKLTEEQKALCKEMEALYLKMEKAGIAFTQNEDGYIVAYNSTHVEDCECSMFSENSDFEAVYQNKMYPFFPFWNNDELYLKMK